jgi:peptidoglycan/xylan/chitin deacetylase (PgdA/CDA1 family)
MKSPILFILALAFASAASGLEQPPVEIHDRLAPQAYFGKKVALTLDACSGKYDEHLVDFLIQNRIPATIFATKKWLDRNPEGVSVIKSHLDLFDVENHGARHIPAVIGKGKTVYGIPGEPDVLHLRREILGGARAVEQTTGIAPRWYRAATAEYDSQSVEEIEKLGYKIAGFSVNADNGATLKQVTIEKRLERVKAGDVIIAHMNKPESDSAKGLAVGLAYLLKQGFVFVRLDQVDLEVIPEQKRGKAGAKPRP